MNEQAPIKRTTRQHKSGNSYSVRLPRDMAYPDPDQELEIEMVGDTRVLRPKRITMAEMFAKLDALRAQGAMGPSDTALIRGYGRPMPGEIDDLPD